MSHQFRLAILYLGIGLFFMGSPLQSPKAQETVKVGTSGTGMLIWLADAKGYLDGAGLTLEKTSSGVIAARRVSEGSLSFGTSSEFALVSHLLDTPDLCAYATISASRTTRLVSRADRVGPGPDALKDSRIAVIPNAIGQYFLSQFLLLSGIPEDQVTLVPGKPSEIVDLILEGSVDAAMTWEPYVSRIRNGLGSLAQSYAEQGEQYFYFVLHGRCDLKRGGTGGASEITRRVKQGEPVFN